MDKRLLLSDPVWRLSNLYSIKRADDGRVVKFKPRAEQAKVFDMVHGQKLKRIIILKYDAESI